LASLHDFQTAKVRQAAKQELRHAEAELMDAQSQADEDCGVGISIAVISRIRAAEKRVEKARAALRAIDPTSTE
jgi:hypothetical protein